MNDTERVAEILVGMSRVIMEREHREEYAAAEILMSMKCQDVGYVNRLPPSRLCDFPSVPMVSVLPATAPYFLCRGK